MACRRRREPPRVSMDLARVRYRRGSMPKHACTRCHTAGTIYRATLLELCGAGDDLQVAGRSRPLVMAPRASSANWRCRARALGAL